MDGESLDPPVVAEPAAEFFCVVAGVALFAGGVFFAAVPDVVFFAVVLLAVVFFAVVLLAVVFFAAVPDVVFFAVAFFAVVFFAVVFFAVGPGEAFLIGTD